MKKLLSLMMLLMTIVIGAKADTEYSPEGGSSNAAISGTSFTIDGKFNAGSGTKMDPMTNKGAKIRNNQGDVVIAVNDGYRIDGLSIYAASNDGSKTIIFTDVKVDGVQVPSLTVDGTEVTPTDGAYSIQVASKNASAATVIKLPAIAATDKIELTIGGTHNQARMQLKVDYTQTEVITQEITGATLYGAALSSDQIATLKSTNALTIDGSSLNGMGVLGVTLNTGATTPTVSIDGNNAVYTFSINGGADEYTVTVTNVVKTYDAAQGSVVYYDENALSNSSKTLTIDDIAFNYASKTFGYANNTAGVTLGGTTYKPIKLSTGEAVTVTFPTGKKATKIIVYGWSNGGNGKLVNFTDGGEKSIDTSNDIFYGEDLAVNTYPSVYEYDVDNWEAFTFQGNGGQPFVVFDFVFASSGKEASDLAVSDAEASVNIEATTDVTYTTTSTGTVTVESSAPAVATATVDESTKTITITGVAAGTATITVSQAEDDNYDSGSKTIAVTVTDPNIKTVYDVTGLTSDEFVLNQTNVTNADNAFVTATDNWQTGSDKNYGAYTGLFLNMSKADRTITFKVKGAENFRVLVQNSTSGRSYTVKVGSAAAETITHEGAGVEASDIFETGSTGEVTITIAGDGSGSVYPVAIQFNIPQTTINLNSKGFATYSSKYDFTFDGADAYGMKLSETSLVGTKVTSGKVKAGEGILFKGEAGATVTITGTTGAEAIGDANNLIGTTNASEDIISSSYNYMYSLSGDTFMTFTGSLQANKAFFGSDTAIANSLDMVFEDEATAINGVNANENANAGVKKFFKNGQLVIETANGVFTAAGAQVK